ncbi:MAG: tetratricopeptide repeat protein [bacterium]|nr:tetratricopeptide repeat protein [bacterium]
MRNKKLVCLFLLCIHLSAVFFPVESLVSREGSTALYKKGEQLALRGKIDESIRVFKQVVELSPYYCLGHYGLGKAYLYKEGFLEDAVKHLKRSVRLDREFAPGYFYLGMAHFLSEEYRYAIPALKQAYHGDSTILEALYNLSVIYDIIHKKLQAKLYLRKYLLEKEREEDDDAPLFDY